MNMDNLTFTPLKRLYDNSSDPNRITKYNSRKKRMQFLELVSTGNIKKVEGYLKKGIDPNFCEKHAQEESTPLIEATKIKSPQTMLSILVAHHAHPSFHDNHTLTAVHHCAIHGRDDALETLRMLGSGMDYEDANELTPLYLGVQRSLTKRGLNILLGAGVNLRVVDKSLYTVLHHACVNGRDDLISDLVRCGADVNAQNHIGNTSLHLATYLNKVACVEVLLRLGADPTVRNSEGKVAADLSAQLGPQTSFTTLNMNTQDRNHSLKNSQQNSQNGHDTLLNNECIFNENVGNNQKTKNEDPKEKPPSHIHHNTAHLNTNGSTEEHINRNIVGRTINVDTNVGTVGVESESGVKNSVGVGSHGSKENGGSLHENKTEEKLVNNENNSQVTTPPTVVNKEIEAMKLKKISERNRKEKMVNKDDDDDEPKLVPRGLIKMEERVVVLGEGKEEMGFVLRGAHSEESSIPTFHPSILQPALQYFSFVKPDSSAHKAGILTNDFLLEVNGVSVVTASHQHTAELIRRAVKDEGGVKMRVATVVFPGTQNGPTSSPTVQTNVRFHSLNMIKEDSEDEAENAERKVENGPKDKNSNENVELLNTQQNLLPKSVDNQEQKPQKSVAKPTPNDVKPNGIDVKNNQHDTKVENSKISSSSSSFSSFSSSSSSFSLSPQPPHPTTFGENFPPPPTRTLLDKLIVENTKVHQNHIESDTTDNNNNNIRSDVTKNNNNKSTNGMVTTYNNNKNTNNNNNTNNINNNNNNNNNIEIKNKNHNTNGKVPPKIHEADWLLKKDNEDVENMPEKVAKSPKNKVTSIINAFNRQNSYPPNYIISEENNNNNNTAYNTTTNNNNNNSRNSYTYTIDNNSNNHGYNNNNNNDDSSKNNGRKEEEKDEEMIDQWGVEEVSLWLHSINLHKYAIKFKSESVDGAKLRSMKRNDLISLGVKDVKDRMVIERSLLRVSRSPSSC